jgi:PAS domain S-box-containing protein
MPELKMNFLNFLHFIILLSNIALIIYLSVKNEKSLLNTSCIVIIFCFCLWDFSMIFTHNPAVPENIARLFYNIASIGWICFSAVFLWLACIFCEKTKILKTKLFYLLLFSLPLLLINRQFAGFLVTGYIKQYYGWAMVWGNTFWSYLFFFYLFFFMGIGFYFIFSFWKSTEDTVKRNQAKIIFNTSLIPLVIGTITDIVLPELGIYVVPNIASMVAFIWTLGIVYAMAKHQFLKITPATAASNIVSTMAEALILLDEAGKIVDVNSAAKELLGYQRDELRGQSFALVLPEDFRKTFLKGLAEGRSLKSCDTRFITKHSKNISINLSVSPLKDSFAHVVGFVVVATDITEHKRTEESLRASEARYQTYLEVTGQIGWTTPPDGLVADMPAWRKYTGQTPEEVKGWGWLNAIHPDDRKRTTEAWNKAVATKSTFETEYRIRRNDGIYRYFLDRGIPSVLEDGSVHEWVGTCIDITERKQAEEALRTEREFSNSLINTAQAIILVLDTKGCIVTFNPYMEQVSGYRLQEVQGKDWFETFIPEEIRPRTRELFLKAIGDIQTKGNVNAIIAKDGHKPQTEWYDKTLKKDDGSVYGLLSIGQDITERKRIDEILRENEAKYKLLVENLPQMIFFKDRNSVYASCNKNYARAMKIKADEIKGKNDYDFYPKELAEKYRADDKRIMEFGQTEDFEEKYIQDGQEGFSHTVKTPARDEQGNVIGVLGISWDITERKRMEEALVKSEHKFRVFFESSRDAIMTLEPPSWKFTSGNSSTIKMFMAKNEADFICHEPWVLSPERQPDGRASGEKAKEMIETAMRVGSNFFEWTHKRLNGEEFPATVLLTRAVLAEKTILQATVRDNTERKKMEEEIQRRLSELEVFYKASIGREERILELKKRIAGLEEKLKGI